MATLLRTEAVGFIDFLHRVGVPGVRPLCPCGWERQTPKHIVMFCPRFQGRERMLAEAGTVDYYTLINTATGLRAVTSWLIRVGALAQFSVAKEMGGG